MTAVGSVPIRPVRPSGRSRSRSHIRLNAAFLDGVGLGTLPPDAQASLLKSVKASLEETVGWRIALRLTDPEIKEISNLSDSGDERGALAWLDSHVPEHGTSSEPRWMRSHRR